MDDRERTIYCGNLSDRVTEDLLYELFLQAGPVENVTIPKDKDGRLKNFGFIRFKHAVSVQYAVALMNDISLYGRPLRLDPRSNSGEINPYMQKLQEYKLSQQASEVNNLRGYPQSNTYLQPEDRYQNGNRYRDSRRNDQPLINLNQMHAPILYQGFPPQLFSLTLPPPIASTPLMIPNPYQNHGRYDNYRNSRSNYRR